MLALLAATLPHLVEGNNSHKQQGTSMDSRGFITFAANDGHWKAGSEAQRACEALKDTFKSSSLELNRTFSQYWAPGSNPSMKLLSDVYPSEALPKRPNMNSLLLAVAPDYDVTGDFGYGASGGPLSSQGPMGGLPAFCRFGSFIKTSEHTEVLAEVWLPLAYDPSASAASVNASDFPTNTTPFRLDPQGSIIKQPVWAANAASKKKGGSSDSVTDVGDSSPRERRSNDVGGRHQPHGSGRHHTHDQHGHGTGPVDGHELLGLNNNGSDGWNGRLLYVGNGGFRGYAPLGGIKQAMSRYRFAVVGSNAGHFSTTGGATWINGTQREDTLKDWGHRATKVSQELALEVVQAWYGKAPQRKYYTGCSNGGKAGLASALADPGMFDGIIAGCPGVNFARMNAGQINFQSKHNKNLTGDGWFSVNFTQYSVHQTILDQCDSMDGVVDGVVNNPLKCKPNFEKDLLCGAAGAKFGGSILTCLTQPQIDNLKGLYRPLYLNNTFIYDAFPVTWEQRSSDLRGSARKAGGLYEFAVVKAPNQEDSDFDYWHDITADLVEKGEKEGADWDTGKTDYSASVKADTKIISYHGLSDQTISPYNTIRYWQNVAKDSGVDVSNNIRFYPIPGMSHCRDGEGAWHFGGASQYEPGSRPLQFDTRHDLLLSLVAWVERGHAEPYQVGAHYNQLTKVLPPDPSSGESADKDVELPTWFESFDYGVKNTRKHCPWPKQAIYQGGETTGDKAYQSYRCEDADWGSLPQ